MRRQDVVLQINRRQMTLHAAGWFRRAKDRHDSLLEQLHRGIFAARSAGQSEMTSVTEPDRCDMLEASLFEAIDQLSRLFFSHADRFHLVAFFDGVDDVLAFDHLAEHTVLSVQVGRG